MSYLWDYSLNKLKKTSSGKVLVLERMINLGLAPKSKNKISLSEVKENWSKLKLTPTKKRLFELLIWGK